MAEEEIEEIFFRETIRGEEDKEKKQRHKKEVGLGSG